MDGLDRVRALTKNSERLDRAEALATLVVFVSMPGVDVRELTEGALDRDALVRAAAVRGLAASRSDWARNELKRLAQDPDSGVRSAVRACRECDK